MYAIDVCIRISIRPKRGQADMELADKNHGNVTHHTCIACSSTLTIPSPPTEIGNNVSNGSRRAKLAARCKVSFHEREMDEAVEGAKGHTLWRGETKLYNWGAPETTPEQSTHR